MGSGLELVRFQLPVIGGNPMGGAEFLNDLYRRIRKYDLFYNEMKPFSIYKKKHVISMMENVTHRHFITTLVYNENVTSEGTVKKIFDVIEKYEINRMIYKKMIHYYFKSNYSWLLLDNVYLPALKKKWNIEKEEENDSYRQADPLKELICVLS